MIRARFVAWLGFFLYCNPIVVSSQVRLWKGTMALPVYDGGQPDRSPPFDQFGGPISDPYALRESPTDRPIERSLHAIYLENVYLKCSVLPDLGGPLYTSRPKFSGQSVFYANPSTEKASIGARGAWAAFGDEFNCPVSHNWVSLSPVDFSDSSHPDASASVMVGNMDRFYGMEWTVEMTLRPASTVVEQGATLTNCSDVRSRFYSWPNAGVRARGDSRIWYSTHLTSSQGFADADIDSWPLNTSVDNSIVRTPQDGSASGFVYGSRKPFLGIRNPHTNAGIRHDADGDLHKAEQHLQTAVALEPDDLRTIEEQAAVLHVLHHDACAATFAAQALARFPNSNFLREQVAGVSSHPLSRIEDAADTQHRSQKYTCLSSLPALRYRLDERTYS